MYRHLPLLLFLLMGTKAFGQNKQGTIKVKRLPQGYFINALTDKSGPMGKEMLMAAVGLEAFIERDGQSAEYEVAEIEMTYVTNDGDSVVAEVTKGKRFTRTMLQWIRNCKGGDLFYINHIMLTGADGVTKRFRGIMLHITDGNLNFAVRDF